jgi:hypothetical protein
MLRTADENNSRVEEKPRAEQEEELVSPAAQEGMERNCMKEEEDASALA